MTAKIVYRVRVEMPRWHPARLNQMKGHWSCGARLKKADRRTVALYCRLAGVKAATGKRRVTLHVFRSRADPDAYWKSLLDALVACGALEGDSASCVELAPVEYTWAAERATVITLEDVP